ncbi:Transthyretin-like family-containing protein [Strongyloides ratti]|uniref:Transthyretin-like family-containing protein n=1 Tax=Strongyloides ratti TaxID=34506 RepID=A0A090L8C2_STRRB|nr:Transthyretin-like family-containing protein [Strongyloides ratti]CEF66002.1 Transthyretin-like family-containing protein [Strongyloides ratti]
MFSVLILFLIFNTFIPVIGWNFRNTESASVRGIVLCNGRPQRRIMVKMYEEDTIHDDLMAKTKTNRRGAFRIAGYETEYFSHISVHVNIYHKCFRGSSSCTYKYTVKVPSNFICQGTNPYTTYRLGKINMQKNAPPGTWGTKDCFH